MTTLAALLGGVPNDLSVKGEPNPLRRIIAGNLEISYRYMMHMASGPFVALNQMFI
jgi:hypothetical protein